MLPLASRMAESRFLGNRAEAHFLISRVFDDCIVRKIHVVSESREVPVSTGEWSRMASKLDA